MSSIVIKKYYCDKCGIEVKPYNKFLDLYLCENCALRYSSFWMGELDDE